MACPALATGQRFLGSVLDHIDCQASTLGSAGFRALAQPGGLAQILLGALLALTFAMIALRIMAGRGPWGADLISLILRIGTALMLALSWPAFQVLVYDTILHGPAEVAYALQLGENLPGSTGAMTARLQNADNAIVVLTERGTGRETFAPVAEGSGGFKGMGLDDRPAIGWARVAFLAGTLGPLVAIRLAAGFLLALMPLVAGLLLLPQTRGLFAGWVKALFLCFVASVGLTVLYSVELALLEPWLASAFQARASGYATPSAPTELLVLTLAFATAALLMIGLLSRVAFHQVTPEITPLLRHSTAHLDRANADIARLRHSGFPERPLGLAATEPVGGWQQGLTAAGRVPVLVDRRPAPQADAGGSLHSPSQNPLGSSNRRASSRRSAVSQRRDGSASGYAR